MLTEPILSPEEAENLKIALGFKYRRPSPTNTRFKKLIEDPTFIKLIYKPSTIETFTQLEEIVVEFFIKSLAQDEETNPVYWK